MGVLDTVGAITDKVSAGGSILSLVGLTKAFVTGQDLPKGIAGFVFDIPKTESVTYGASITDHFVESNYTIQDHVAFDPIKITLTGDIGELVYKKTEAAKYASAVLGTLTSLKILSPSVSQKAEEYISEAERLKSAADSVIKGAGSLASMIGLTEPQLTAQQKAHKTLYDFFYGRSRLTVETPWKTFESMIIETFTVDQDESSNDLTHISVTFKQLRVVTTTINVGQLKGRIKQQKAPPVDLGKQPGGSVLFNTSEKISSFGKP